MMPMIPPGGGGMPAPQEQGPPPELLALLQGGAGGGGEAPPAEPESPSQILTRMIDDAKLYLEVEQDPEDQATMSDLLRTLIQYLANEQKEQDAAMGGKFSPRIMRKFGGG